MSLEVFTLVWLRILVFWDVLMCHWMTDSQCFEGKSCLCYQGSCGPWTMFLKHWGQPTQWHSITSWKTEILKLFFIHVRCVVINRCWSDWCCIPGIRNCSGSTGLCCWVCCQTKCFWVSHPQTAGYTGYVYINVIHFVCWNRECKSLWLVTVMLKSECITLLKLHC